MRDWEKERTREISEIIMVTHIVCVLILLMVLASHYNFTHGVNSYWPIGFAFLTFYALGANYLARSKLSRTSFLRHSRMDELLLIAVMFAFAFVFLLNSYNSFGGKVLMMVPIIICAISFGQYVGMAGAALAGILIFAMDYRIFHGFPPDVFQIDVIVVGVSTLLAFLVGSLMSVERKTQQGLAELADYDRLTGLVNHRYCQEKLTSLLTEAAKKGGSLSVSLLDIDQFRYYNHVYGYQKGDEILAALGDELQKEIKEPCYAARYAGDKFMLVLPGKNRDEAINLSEKVRDNMIARADNCLYSEGASFSFRPFGMPLGIASYPADGIEALPLIRAAEDDLFRAKTTKGKAYLYKSILTEIGALRIQDAFPWLQGLITLINLKDKYTFGHSERVEAYSLALAEKMGLSDDDKNSLRYGAYLHDIGKIEIEISVLRKKGPLQPGELEAIRNHPALGSEIIEPIVVFQDVIPIIRSHHEDWNGAGYPDGLAGEEIPINARIIRIVDSFDAMVTDRPYRKALSFPQACEELRKGSGIAFDPTMVEKFIELVEDNRVLP